MVDGLENHMDMWQKEHFPEVLDKVYMESNKPLEIYFWNCFILFKC